MAHHCSNKALGCYLLFSIVVSIFSTFTCAHFDGFFPNEPIIFQDTNAYAPTLEVDVIEPTLKIEDDSQLAPPPVVGAIPPTFEVQNDAPLLNERLKKAYVVEF